MAKFILYKDKAGEYRWTLWSDKNNKRVADSAEGYVAKAGAINGINWVKSNSKADIEDRT